MKYCIKCGQPLENNAAFCSACGAAQSQSGNDETTQLNIVNTPLPPSLQPAQTPKNEYSTTNKQTLYIIIIVAALLLTGGCVALLLTSGPKVVEETPAPAITEVVEQSAPAPQITKLKATVKPTMHIPRAGKLTYDAQNMLDGNPSTAWTVDTYEGDNGYGEIDLLEFSLNAKELDHIMLTNGYAKSSKLHRANARAQSVAISRVPWDEALNEDIIYSGPLKDTMKPQYLKVNSNYDNTRPTNKIYIRFPSIIYGDKYYTDFCISEIEFYGIPN